MKKLIIPLFLGLVLASCRKEEPTVIYPNNTYPNNITNISGGDTGYVTDINLSGQGNQSTQPNSTIIISGDVTLDALSINGEVIVTEGSTLTVNSQLQVNGAGEMTVHGDIVTPALIINDDAYFSNSSTLTVSNQIQVSGGADLFFNGIATTPILTQIGDLILDDASITVTGKYTQSGGTNLYMQNSVIHVDEYVLSGDIEVIDNDFTELTNKYSVINFIGDKYFNRSYGSNICGPVLFTSNDNQGSNPDPINEVSPTVISDIPQIYSIYSIDEDNSFFQFDSQSTCSPKSTLPTFSL